MKNRLPGIVLLLNTFILIVLLASCTTRETYPDGSMLNELNWREIGPGTYGGRISDIAVASGSSNTLFVSPSTGGIYRSVDDGMSWDPVFDRAGNTLAIGDIDISASDPEIIWAGSGEASGEQSPASIGDGVYKSTDGGDTWTNMGLENSRHISKVVIHPENPEIVFVGSTGSRWGENEERGVYRTLDGGNTWERVLYINPNTGISDIVIMPDGKTLFASAWEQRRNAWAHVRTGPNSGLYRSDDGGDNWVKVEGGLPGDNIGRIALAIAPSDENIIYAVLEHDSLGFFRSDDGGATWTHKNDKIRTSYWYGRIYVDPADADRVWVMGVYVMETTDGGDNFHPVIMKNVHVDHHIAWFDPSDDKHIILGNDGGLYFTHDGGNNWDFVANFPAGQYYDISIDNRDPYWIYGGLQDNGVWGGPSRSVSGLPVSNSDIKSISGGDGFYSASEPLDPETVYGESQYGGLVRFDHVTGKRTRIKPSPGEGEEEYRFNWNTPFFISVHKPNMLYIGGNKLFRSADRGETWETISPDLSRNLELDTIMVIGQKPVLKPYCSITALSESPIRKGLIYAGTDDGRLHVTMDDGATWTDISGNLPAPPDRFFTRLCASIFDEATAYAAFGRFYEADDLSPHIFRTTDYGATWTPVSGNLPPESIVMGLAEYQGNPDILFAGTHKGLYLSADKGLKWSPVNGQLPNVAVSDIIIAPDYNDLVLGTYGRGLWILDDISFLDKTGDDVFNSDIYLFEPKIFRSGLSADSVFTPGKYHYVAPEPASGLVVTWYNREEISNMKRLPELTVTNESGHLSIQQLLPGKMGFNRVVLDNQHLEPGNYQVTVTSGKKSVSRTLKTDD